MKARHQQALLTAFGLKTLKSRRIDWLEPPLDNNYGLRYLAKKVNCDLGTANKINHSLGNVRRIAFLKTWQIPGHQFLGLPRYTRSLWKELKFHKYSYILPTPLIQMRVMAKENRFSEFLELILKHKKNIGMISTPPTESNASSKVIGIRWNNQSFFSKKGDYALIPEDIAIQLLTEKTRETILNKPSNTNEFTKNKIIDRPKKSKNTLLYSMFKIIVKRLWKLLNNLIYK